MNALRIVVVIFFPFFMSAQESWQYNFDFGDTKFIDQPIELNNGEIFFPYHSLRPNNNDIRFYKLDADGHEISNKLYQHEYSEITLMDYFYREDLEEICMLFYIPLEGNPHRFKWVKMDEDFNIIHDSDMELTCDIFNCEEKFDQLRSIRTDQGTIVAFGIRNSFGYSQNTPNTGCTLFEFTFEGELLRTANYPLQIAEAPYFVNHLVQSWDSNLYYSNHSRALIVNLNLDSIEVRETELEKTFSNNTFAYRWKEGQYIHATDGNAGDWFIEIFDDDLEVIESNRYDEPGVENEILGYVGTSFNFIDHDVLYLVGEGFPYPSQYTWVAQYNEDLEQNWFHVLGTEDLVRYSIAVTPTRDGGALVSFFEAIGASDFRPRLFKISKDGNLPTSIADLENGDYSLSVFPNPSRGEFYLELESYSANQCKLQLINNAGTIVYENESLIHGQNKYDLSHLNNGVYQYQLFKEGKLLVSGKWIKMD